MRKIIPGEADKSYGIQVAKLAGIPDAIIKKAKKIMTELEQNHPEDRSAVFNIAESDDISSKNNQLNLDIYKNEEIIKQIKSVDIDVLTPLEALNILFSIKQQLV